VKTGVELAVTVEPDQPIAAGPQEKEKEVGVVAVIKCLAHLTVIGGTRDLKQPPVLDVFFDQPVGIALDDLPECDQGLAGVAALEPTYLDVGAQEFVEDRPTPEKGFVVGGDLAGELGDDLPCLTPLAPCPLDQDVLKVGGGGVVGPSGTEIIRRARAWVHRGSIPIFTFDDCGLRLAESRAGSPAGLILASDIELD
jgi:hypothetical protein